MKILLIFFSLLFLINEKTYAKNITAQLMSDKFLELENKAKRVKPLNNYNSIKKNFISGELIEANELNTNLNNLKSNFPLESFNNDIFVDGTIIKESDFNNKIDSVGTTLDNIKISDFVPIDGDLIISNGQTVDISSGSVKRYSSLNIESGGTLRIIGNNLALTEIAVNGDVTINGQIIGDGFFVGSSINKVSEITGENISFNILQASGGNGGASAPTVRGGGSQHSGNGGGGARADSPNVANSGAVGNNATANSAGASIGCNSNNQGGLRGNHGHSLLLIANGQILGTGSINLSGKNGSNGGYGGVYGWTGVNSCGGGGAGAGGSAGYLKIKYFQQLGNININTNGGIAGSPGAGGTGGQTGSGSSGGSAQNGSSSNPIIESKY